MRVQRPNPDGAANGGEEAVRTGLLPETIARAYRDNLCCLQGRFPEVTTRNDAYMALAYTVRDRLLRRWVRAAQTYLGRRSRTVCYLSAEYLLGPQLGNNLMVLGIGDPVRQAARQLDLDLEQLIEHEEEPGLGNGGLGRLAACFLDSMATQGIPCLGYGLRYEFGIFDQEIRDGWQVELADKWLRLGNPWEIPRPETAFDVQFGGRTEEYEENGRSRVRWIPGRVVRGMAYDTPIPGYGIQNANLLRLWKAEATESFDFRAFNTGDYYGAVMEKIASETITKVLYPNDEVFQGKELRLQQQYFFASCTLQDLIRIFSLKSRDLSQFHRTFAVQLNDTHPAIAVAELMRLLVDVHGMEWGEAWRVTENTFSYTNHTLLPEALEHWAVPLLSRLLPRHYQIICEINHHFLDAVRLRYPGDEERAGRMSLIDENGERSVRMAHLACVGSRVVNGVSELHSDLLEQGVLRDFHDFWPGKFTNVTNGVTPRRFILLSNPRLAGLISGRIGRSWVTDLERLRELEPLAENAEFRQAWREAKLGNKSELAGIIRARTGAVVDPDTLFDVQVKRMHEYKRQHLNVLHIVTLYNRIRRGEAGGGPPRTVVFGGKAAPGYAMAGLIIKLIHAVGDVIQADPAVSDRLRVVFVPNFNVKVAQRIYPAADLSEQISTAGREASGTGNMKFAMNGAVTLGTLDGANIEIRREVGEENFFLFGLTASEVQDLHARGYRPRDYYEADPGLKEAIDLIGSGHFSPGQPRLFQPLIDRLLQRDDYMLLADYASYVECQGRAGKAYEDAEAWTRMSILNVARMGYFSSDRAIREYSERIWKVAPVPVYPGGAA